MNTLSIAQWVEDLRAQKPAVAALYATAIARPGLDAMAEPLAKAYSVIAASLAQGGTLFLCGNGGSMSDALHISGEMLKSFARPRPLPATLQERLREQPDGEALAKHLQAGLRAHVLGLNPTLASAVANDIPVEGAAYAQELVALARPGDALLGISTSGKAHNVRLAASAARALGVHTIGLTGRGPNPLSTMVDIALCVPERETYHVQELHEALYHQLCLMLEAHFF